MEHQEMLLLRMRKEIKTAQGQQAAGAQNQSVTNTLVLCYAGYAQEGKQLVLNQNWVEESKLKKSVLVSEYGKKYDANMNCMLTKQFRGAKSLYPPVPRQPYK